MLKFIVCDDIEIHNQHMKSYLDRICIENTIPAMTYLVTDDPKKVLLCPLSDEQDTNVYILDIDFKSDLNGIDLAKQIRSKDFRAYFIFVTAHQEYTLLSFKIKTFDFLLKPVSYKILEECILSLNKDYIENKNLNSNVLTVKSGNQIYTFNEDDIIYIEKFGKIMIVHTNNKIIRCYETFENIENRLDKSKFFRCHKSYLINIKKIKSIDVKNNMIVMSNNDTCLLSRKYKKELLEKCQ